MSQAEPAVFDDPFESPELSPSESYWEISRQPLTSLVFIAPLLLVYEVGVLLPIGASARNGVDVWLRTLLDWVGFGEYFLLPVLTVCILLGWHYTTRRPWRVSWRVLGRMAVESLVLAICLRAILEVQSALMRGLLAAGSAETLLAVEQAGANPAMSERLGNLIMFLGAGIYEELLFRLILLSALIVLLCRVGMTRTMGTVYAVALSSLLFAAAHHVGPHGEAFLLQPFLFRFVAGVFFCILFIGRGFGIAAGTHAGYDILVGLLP
ncbi:MAG: CPBP family intramembrane metalloprotease [Pirellulaceae bacterium]|nr:CPBP family intramembrane metalloprotease [Pirellulaceae bacterium]